MYQLNYRMIFVLSGVILILSAAIIETNFQTSSQPIARILTNVLLSAGVTILAVGVVDLIWSKLGGEPLSKEINRLAATTDLVNDSRTSGLLRIHATVEGASRPTWEKLIEKCQNSIDLCGYQLLDIADSQAAMRMLEQKAHAGVTIRVVLPNPDSSPGLDHAAAEWNIEAMRSNARHSMKRFNELNVKLPDDAKLILLQVANGGAINASMRRFDDTVYIVPYLFSINTPDSPLLVVEATTNKADLFKTYKSWLDELAKTADRVAADTNVGKVSLD